MAQLLILKHKGLYTAPNEFSAVPEGALVLANNCVINADGVIEPRRGNDRLLQFADGNDRGARYAVYEDRLIANYTGGKLAYRSGSSWVVYSGTYSHPSDTLARLRFHHANNNLYFTTSAGIYKLDAYTGTPTLAGMYKGLDIQLALDGSSGFLAVDNQVAYRCVWGIRDAQENVVKGAPSGRAIIANPSTGTGRNVILTITIPSGITTSHFLQIYRSNQSGGDDIEPDDELGLVYENNPTAPEIAAGVLILNADRTTDDLRGEILYTSPSLETIFQANERPPQADDIEDFQSCTIYANIVSKHRKIFTILACGGTAGINFSDTLTIAGTTYTAYGTEDSGVNKRYSLHADFTTTGDTTNTNATLTNVASTVGCEIGRAITGTNIPASTTIVSFTANTIVMSANATGSTAGVTFTISTGGTPAQNIFDTAESLVRIINRNATNTTVYAYYISNPSELPGQILIEERGLGGASFAFTVSARGVAFNPVLPTSGVTVSSSNDDFQDAIMISKPGQAEAVPLINIRRVGSANNPVRRVRKLRNTLFIFKEREGIYRMTGTDPSNFEVELFDSSAKLIAPDSVDVVNNEIWCLCDQGVTVVTETGVSVVTRPIEDLVTDIFGPALTQVQYYSWGIGYETDRKYILNTVQTNSETSTSQAFVFNVFTRAWTRWPVSFSAGIVNPVDDKLYLADAASEWTLKERKTRDYTDQIDYGTTFTLSSSTGTTVVLTSTTGITAGDLLYESSSVFSVITEVQPGVLTVADSDISWTPGSVTVYRAFEASFEYAAMHAGNPGSSKHFQEVALLAKASRYNTATISFATDISAGFESVDIAGSQVGDWGLFEWGDEAWGGESAPVPMRTYVPLEKSRGSYLRVRFTMREGYGYFKMQGVSLKYREFGSMVVSK